MHHLPCLSSLLRLFWQPSQEHNFSLCAVTQMLRAQQAVYSPILISPSHSQHVALGTTNQPN